MARPSPLLPYQLLEQISRYLLPTNYTNGHEFQEKIFGKRGISVAKSRGNFV